jgi:hypothetical protein
MTQPPDVLALCAGNAASSISGEVMRMPVVRDTLRRRQRRSTLPVALPPRAPGTRNVAGIAA